MYGENPHDCRAALQWQIHGAALREKIVRELARNGALAEGPFSQSVIFLRERTGAGRIYFGGKRMIGTTEQQ